MVEGPGVHIGRVTTVRGCVGDLEDVGGLGFGDEVPAVEAAGVLGHRWVPFTMHCDLQLAIPAADSSRPCTVRRRRGHGCIKGQRFRQFALLWCVVEGVCTAQGTKTRFHVGAPWCCPSCTTRRTHTSPSALAIHPLPPLSGCKGTGALTHAHTRTHTQNACVPCRWCR